MATTWPPTGTPGSDREWLEGLGTALALARRDLDLRAWVADECRDLPLSVWDAEEDPDGFALAEQVAQHWFLVALLAIPERQKFGRPLEPPRGACPCRGGLDSRQVLPAAPRNPSGSVGRRRAGGPLRDAVRAGQRSVAARSGARRRGGSRGAPRPRGRAAILKPSRSRRRFRGGRHDHGGTGADRTGPIRRWWPVRPGSPS